MSETQGKRWRLPDGRVLCAGKGLGDAFMTIFFNPDSPGRHRFKSKHLPVRASLAEAQADLDAWASKGRLMEEV